MDQIEKNIIKSFEYAKKDIMSLQQDIVILTQKQQEMTKIIHELKSEISRLKTKKEVSTKIITKTLPRKKSEFIASQNGGKFHVNTCPFGQNIKPKSKLKFSSKIKALNEGFKPCVCIK